MFMLLHCMQFGLVGEEHLAEQLLGWLLFLFQPFPLFAFLLMFLVCYSPISSGAKIQVGRELKFTWLFWFTEGTPTESQLGAVAPIACSGPRQHPPAFSCCSATLKIHNVPIQITKIIKLLLAEVSNFVLFLFSTSVAATLHNTSLLLLTSSLKENVKLIHV